MGSVLILVNILVVFICYGLYIVSFNKKNCVKVGAN